MSKRKPVDYEATPTLWKFHNSKAFVRSVRGPVGSGKSTACCWEIWRRAAEQKPAADGIRYSAWAVVRNCYDSQTEILTERRGWVRFADLDPSDAVATLKDGRMTFEVPSYHYAAPYHGEMVGLRSQNLDLLVTPDHKLWASPRQGRAKVWQDYRHVKAMEIEGLGETWRMTAVALPVAGGAAAESEALFEFLGFWFAEGYAGKYPRPETGGWHWRLVVTQKRNVAYLEALLARLGWSCGKTHKTNGCYNFSIHVSQDGVKGLIERLIECGGNARDKLLPLWVRQAPAGHLRAFLRGYMAGDGHVREGSNDSSHLYTASRALADGLQEIIARSGGASVVNYDRTNNSYVVTLLTPKRQRPIVQKRTWRREYYDGMVYCVEVSTHVVYVRRNGKAVWCGQTYRELKDTTVATWLDWFSEDRVGKFNYSDLEHRIRFGDIDLTVMFRSLDKPQDIKKILSLEITGAWFNEAREMSRAIVNRMAERVGRYPPAKDGGPTWYGMILDTNPPDEDHWLMEAERNGIEGWEFFVQPGGLIEVDGKLTTNPLAENLKYLPPGYYENNLGAMKMEEIKVYRMNIPGFVTHGKPVTPEFNQLVHAAKQLQPIDDLPLTIGIDIGGGTLNPAAIFLQRARRGNILALHEEVGSDLGVEAFGRMLKQALVERFPKHLDRLMAGDDEAIRIVCDPAAHQRDQIYETVVATHLAQVTGIKVAGAPTQDPKARVDALRAPMTRLIDGQPGFMVDPRCRKLVKGLNGGWCYQRLQTSGERYSDKPDKGEYSHPCEACAYALLGMGEYRTLQGVNNTTERRERAARPAAWVT